MDIAARAMATERRGIDRGPGDERALRSAVRRFSEEGARMSSRSIVLRAGVGLVLVLAAVAAVAPGPTSRAQEQDNGLASITIYNAVCPPDYTGGDYYADCYGTPGGG